MNDDERVLHHVIEMGFANPPSARRAPSKREVLPVDALEGKIRSGGGVVQRLGRGM